MELIIRHKLQAFEIELTEQELLDNFIKCPGTGYSMFNIANKALGEVSWHDNMPKSSKLSYIAMLQKHIDSFLSDLNRNNDLNALIETKQP